MESLGRHILVEYYGCSRLRMNDYKFIEKSMVQAAKNSGCAEVTSTGHHFSPFGVSLVVVFYENQLTIHTWPEYGYAAVDLLTGQGSVDLWTSFKYLKEAFLSTSFSVMEVKRGILNHIQDPEPLEYLQETIEEAQLTKSVLKFRREAYYVDFYRDYGIPVRVTKNSILFSKQSKYKIVEVYDTVEFGKMLVEDGAIACTEKDEAYYHEMIAHVPMMSFAEAKRVLVIGGGDGGVARELLKHKNIEEIVVVELDEVIVQAAKLHFPELAASLSNSKVNLVISESQEYLKSVKDGAFDVIIVDETDPCSRRSFEEVGVKLFCDSFWKECHRVLGENGVIVAPSHSPNTNDKEFKEFHKELVGLFGKKNVKPYIYESATSGLMSFAFVSKGKIDAVDTFVGEEKGNQFADEHGLQYYDGEVHLASFILPKKFRNLVAGPDIA